MQVSFSSLNAYLSFDFLIPFLVLATFLQIKPLQYTRYGQGIYRMWKSALFSLSDNTTRDIINILAINYSIYFYPFTYTFYT